MDRCKKCHNVFTPNGTEFCSIKHQRAFNRQNPSKECPNPSKKVYENAEAAWEYIDSRPNDKLFKTNLRPYDDCLCGKIHVGHGEPNKFSRISA